MLIRAYRDIPPTYAPDKGEVVLARRSGSHTYTQAVVLGVRRRGARRLEIKVTWLAGELAGTVSWLDQLDGGPPLIRQISKDQPPAS